MATSAEKELILSNKIFHFQRGAIVVHCSAGIGRSGAIIVIDMICDQIRKYGDSFYIEIQKTVMHCRDHRPGMVQTVEQYAFIHKGNWSNTTFED